jgi:hypothetical protein
VSEIPATSLVASCIRTARVFLDSGADLLRHECFAKIGGGPIQFIGKTVLELPLAS